MPVEYQCINCSHDKKMCSIYTYYYIGLHVQVQYAMILHTHFIL